MSCERARGVLGGLMREAGNCSGGERQGIDVGVMGVGVFAVGGGLRTGEVEYHIPEAARAEEAFSCGIRAMEAEGVARRSAGRFVVGLGAIFLGEWGGGIGLGIGGEESCKLG